MSISSSTRKAGPYSCNGSTVAFPFSFKVFTTADVRVVLTDANVVESDLVLGTNYSVALNADQDANPGGTVTTVATYATGYKVTLTSQVQNLQPVTLTNQGGFYPKIINDALDRLTIMAQQLAEQVGRAVKTSISSSSSTPDQLLSDLNTSVGNAAAAATAASGSATAAAGSATAASGSATAAANSATQAANSAASVGFTVTDLQTQGKTAVTSAGTAPNFTATTSPAYGALAAGQRVRVKFHAAGTTGSNTLNRDGLGAKNLKQYDATGAKVAAIIASGQLADVEYDGTDMVVLDPLPGKGNPLPTVGASVATNALTVTIDAEALDFRSTTLTSGTPVTRSAASQGSLTVPSGATLGTTSGQQSRLVWGWLDNAGTLEPFIVNLAGGLNLDETTLISTTAISGSANASNVIYSQTARSNVPFRVRGFCDITEAAAGTWATAPTLVQSVGGQALAAMSSLGYGQKWTDVTGSRALSTTYYNTSGRPIMVSIKLGAVNDITPTVNGVAVAAGYTSCEFIVPAWHSYSAASGSGFITWSELR